MPKKDHGHRKNASENFEAGEQENIREDAQVEVKPKHHSHRHQHHHHGPHFTGDTVNLFVETVNNNLVTEVHTSSQTIDIGFEIEPGVTTFTDANSNLYQQGFRIVASINDEEGDGALFIYVR